MQDRVATYPGRVKLTPVSGQANTYDLERADQPTVAGTALNKANLLSDTTASLLGLTNPTVNDYLANIINGGFKGFWWKKSSDSYSGTCTTSSYDSGSFTTLLLVATEGFYIGEDYEYYKEGSTSYFRLKNPILVTKEQIVNSSVKPVLFPTLYGKNVSKAYVAIESTTYDKLTSFYEITESVNSCGIGYSASSQKLTLYGKSETNYYNPNATVVHNLLDYVCSADINAYPNGDYATDGYYYELDKSVVCDKVYKWDKGNIVKTKTIESYEYVNIENASSTTRNVSYADDYSVDSNGTVTLINPQTIALSYDNYTLANNLAGKYYQKEGYDTANVWYIPNGATISREYIASNQYRILASEVYIYRNNAQSFSKIGEVTSINENAYPNGGEQDGYYYDSRETINLGGVKIESGSYVGNGESGATAQITLTFGFTPKLVFVRQNSGQGHTELINPCTRAYGVTSGYTGAVLIVSWTNNSVSFYTTGSGYGYQQNISAETYNYIAIG